MRSSLDSASGATITLVRSGSRASPLHLGADAADRDVFGAALPLPALNSSARTTSLVRLTVVTAAGAVLSRKVYWRSDQRRDVLNWPNSTFYITHCTQWAHFAGLRAATALRANVTAAGVTVSACFDRSVPGAVVRVQLALSDAARSAADASAYLLNALVSLVAMPPGSTSRSGGSTVGAGASELQPERRVLWDDNFVSLFGAARDGPVTLRARLLAMPAWNASAARRLRVRIRNETFAIRASC
jgi:hypothetical protein